MLTTGGCAVKQRIFYAVIWLAISAAGGMVGSWLFGLSFFVGSALALGSLLVNGLIIEWEDRRDGM
jgi:hypothetical protein